MSDTDKKLEQATALLKTVLSHFSWRVAVDEAYDEFAPSQLTVDMQQTELTKAISEFLEASA